MVQICQTLEVNRSGYYAWMNRPESNRRKKNLELVKEIRRVHKKNKGRYGAPRITRVLKANGQECSENRVARLMQKEAIFGCQRRKFRPQTTTPNHEYPVAPRILKTEEPETHPTAPNQLWVSDITYVDTCEGWLYLTTFLDLFNRKVVGHAMADSLATEPIWEAMKNGIMGEKEALAPGAAPLMVHSDRGCQYASEYFREKLMLLGVAQSMSRKGNCYDNAYAETFFHTIKVELIHRQKFATREEAKLEITDYIKWYNCERLHSSLDYQTPDSYRPVSLVV